jgi:hypothetical protein
MILYVDGLKNKMEQTENIFGVGTVAILEKRINGTYFVLTVKSLIIPVRSNLSEL